MKLMIINGPNLNLLGIRQVDIYGSLSYKDLVDSVNTFCKKNDINVEIYQTNSESRIIDLIHKAHTDSFDGIIINPAGFTHTSISILDAIYAVNVDCIEVHLSNIYSREEYRNTSLISRACKATMSGFGHYSYILAIMYFLNNKYE